MRRVESFGILVLALGSSALPAQDAKMQFEVASVRAAAPAPKGAPQARVMARGGPGTSDPERVAYERVSF